MKSGTDFRELTLIEVGFSELGSQVTLIEKYIIDSDVPENEKIKALVDGHFSKIN